MRGEGNPDILNAGSESSVIPNTSTGATSAFGLETLSNPGNRDLTLSITANYSLVFHKIN